MMAWYEMITVHRRAANYKLINNRISDTEYKFEYIFLYVIKRLLTVKNTSEKKYMYTKNNSVDCHERMLKQKCWAT